MRNNNTPRENHYEANCSEINENSEKSRKVYNLQRTQKKSIKSQFMKD